MDKAAIRNHVIQHRKQLSPQEVARLSDQIRLQLRALVNWSLVRTVHIYTAQASLNEVDTAGICKLISEEFPAVIVTKGNPSKHALIPTNQFDVVLVPLVAFDASLHRIGFGGGWYDRFLSMQPQARKIGLAFELQRVEQVPVEPHDETLNAVVTEDKVYLPNKNAPL